MKRTANNLVSGQVLVKECLSSRDRRNYGITFRFVNLTFCGFGVYWRNRLTIGVLPAVCMIITLMLSGHERPQYMTHL